MAVCVAIVDKDNSPLLVRTAVGGIDPEVAERTVYTSLDLIEERLSRTGPEAKELYLGLLLSAAELKVFASVSNSKIKFILLAPISGGGLKDQDVRAAFKRLHSLYASIVSNPFFTPGGPLRSRALDSLLNDLLPPVNA